MSFDFSVLSVWWLEHSKGFSLLTYTDSNWVDYSLIAFSVDSDGVGLQLLGWRF